MIIGKMSALLSVVVHGEMGKDLFLHLIQPFLENINKGSHNDGSWKLFPVHLHEWLTTSGYSRGGKIVPDSLSYSI